MQSTLLLGYILIPLTCGVRTYQNSMLGKFNPNVPVPNIIPGFYNMHRIKKTIQEHIQKVNDQIELELSSVNTKPRNFNRDIPGHGVHNNAYPPNAKLRQPNGNETINIGAPSSKAFGQYFPDPPFAKVRGGKNIFNHGRREYDVPIEQPREYSSPLIGKAVREEYNRGMVRNNGGNNGYNGGNNGYNGGNNGYNGGNNGYNGGNNGYNGKNNDDNQDIAVKGGVIKDLTPAEKWWALTATTLDQDSEKQDLNEKYLIFIKSFKGNEIEKDSLGLDIEELASIGYNGGSNGFNGGTTGINRGSTGINGGNNGINGGSNGINGGSNDINGGSNGINGGLNGFANGAKKAQRQKYNIQYTGMKARNKRNNREERGNNLREYNNYGNTYNGENFKYFHDVPAYAKRIKAIPPEKSTVWTKKPLNLNQKRQDLEQQYKRTLDILNEMIFGIENLTTNEL